jgi:hypothetical protein
MAHCRVPLAPRLASPLPLPHGTRRRGTTAFNEQQKPLSGKGGGARRVRQLTWPASTTTFLPSSRAPSAEGTPCTRLSPNVARRMRGANHRPAAACTPAARPRRRLLPAPCARVSKRVEIMSGSFGTLACPPPCPSVTSWHTRMPCSTSHHPRPRPLRPLRPWPMPPMPPPHAMPCLSLSLSTPMLTSQVSSLKTRTHMHTVHPCLTSLTHSINQSYSSSIPSQSHQHYLCC